MKLSFSDLITRAHGYTQLENHQTRYGTAYTDTKGYHIYGHLDLGLRLSAAEDDRPAKRYLEILQAFTTVAERAGKEFDLVIFEVQGERIHLFLETEDGPGLRQNIIDFARLWNAGVNEVVKPKAGADFKSFSMVADFGSTLVVLSNGEDESIVSLGNAANRPAKHLSRWTGTRNGHFKLNVASLRPGGENADAEWEDHDVSEVPSSVVRGLTKVLLNRVTESIDTAVANYMELSAKKLEPVGNAPAHRPLKKQGFAFRADYDGFSARVREVMSGSEQAQQALVDEFSQIMRQVPQDFANGIKGTVTIFPWSGDCANLFIEAEVDYETAQTSLPATAAHAWHKNAKSYQGLHTPQGAHKWVVGILGGQDGATLVARVHTEHREFPVAAGWGWGRSIDAYQASGVGAEDTVIALEDRKALDDQYAEPFKEVDTRFEKASYDALDKACRGTGKVQVVSEPIPFYIGTKKEELPAQRPHSL